MSPDEKITDLLARAERETKAGEVNAARSLILMALNIIKIEFKKWKQQQTR